MIVAYFSEEKFQPHYITTANQSLLLNADWIDLLHPTKTEEQLVEASLNLIIPTREELQEIEPSSRLYKENGTVFMTATMVAKSDSLDPKTDAITLILKDKKLITLRYIEPQAFALFVSHITKLSEEHSHGISLVVTLLEASIDRLADICERVAFCLDEYSRTIFGMQSSDKIKLDYKQLLQELGLNGDLNTKVWESLISFNRLSGFFGQVFSTKFDENTKARLDTLIKDISALSAQVKFLISKVNFLLDATLGMVNIEQNNIIKIFSIAAVIFLPPTLLASIFGMNFHFMPELQWRVGYPIALILMLFSGWLPYKFFKIKKWL